MDGRDDPYSWFVSNTPCGVSSVFRSKARGHAFRAEVKAASNFRRERAELVHGFQAVDCIQGYE